MEAFARILRDPGGGSKMICGRSGPRSRPLWEAIMLVYASICKDSEGSKEGGAKCHADSLGLDPDPYGK